MCLGIVFVHEMGVVGTYHLYAVFFGKLQYHPVRLLLQRECLSVCPLVGIFHFVPLQLQIVVVAKHPLIPLYRLTCSLDVVAQDFCRHLAGDTCRTHDEVFMISLQVLAVGSRTHVESVYPCTGNELYQVLVSVVVLGEHYQVVAALVHLWVAAV